jgi:hypothetical protein
LRIWNWAVWDAFIAGLFRIGPGKLQDVKNTRTVPIFFMQRPDYIKENPEMQTKYLTTSKF